jgi:plasmid maintenance system antidote protein VapI
MREALRDAVRQRALTYAQIEQELGVHRGDLKRLLAGRIDLPVAHVFRLLRILGMEPWKFFLWLLVTEEGGGGRNPTPTPPALPSP